MSRVRWWRARVLNMDDRVVVTLAIEQKGKVIHAYLDEEEVEKIFKRVCLIKKVRGELPENCKEICEEYISEYF